MSEDFISPSIDYKAYNRLLAYNRRHGIPCTRTCKICGKQFEISNTRRRYCSDECVAEAARRHVAELKVPEKTKVCTVCGKTFKTRNSARVYCSKKCGDKVATAKRDERRRAGCEATSDRVCKFCGKTFTPKDTRQKFCCYLCCNAFSKYHVDASVREAQKLSNRQRVCKFCGAEFTASPTHTNAKYCSKKCSDQAFTYGTIAERDRRLEERRAKREASKKTNTFGLTAEQRQAVIDAQEGDPSLLWSRSQTWTPEQRKFAKKRYEEIHGIYGNIFIR